MSASDAPALLAAEYSAKAGAYARHWSPVIRPMALPLLPELPLAKARVILDAGSGTGALLPDLRAAAPAATLIAADRAGGMLRNAPSTGQSAVVMDLQRLAIASQTIDVAVLVFVLFHLMDPVEGLREIRRALVAGGVAGMTTWGVDPGLPGMSFWTEELDRAGAPPDPRDPSVSQSDRMDTPGKIEALAKEAGFASVRITSLTFEHVCEAESLFALQTSCSMPTRRLAALPPDVRAACEERVRSAMGRLPPEELVYRPEVLFCYAYV